MSTKSSSAKGNERGRGKKIEVRCSSWTVKHAGTLNAIALVHNYFQCHLLSISTVETGRVFGEIEELISSLCEVVDTPADGTQHVTFAKQYQLSHIILHPVSLYIPVLLTSLALYDGWLAAP